MVKSNDYKNSNSETLLELLSNEYVLYLNTLNAHWNITGNNFASIHSLLEKQYECLKDIIDDIAERVRILGNHVPAAHSKYIKKSKIDDMLGDGDFVSTIKALCESHKKITDMLRQSIKKVSETEDFCTEDMLISILKEHEKILWMLNSHLDGS